MGLEHQQAGQTAHPVDVGEARFGGVWRRHARLRFAPAVYGSGFKNPGFSRHGRGLEDPVRPSFISKFRATFAQLPGSKVGSFLFLVILLSSFLSSFVSNTTFPATV